jgi:hypothetical protein
MIDMRDLRVGSILALIGEEYQSASPVIAIDEIGLVHLDGLVNPESIENMVGVPFTKQFFTDHARALNKSLGAGMAISFAFSYFNNFPSARVEMNGALIKNCTFIHELQNLMWDFTEIDLYQDNI